MPQGQLVSCPVEPGFDPLAPDFLADPFAVMRSLPLADRPVLYAPAIDYYVVTRYHDIVSIFSDPPSYSAAGTIWRSVRASTSASGRRSASWRRGRRSRRSAPVSRPSVSSPAES
jgi:hypothetical protein